MNENVGYLRRNVHLLVPVEVIVCPPAIISLAVTRTLKARGIEYLHSAGDAALTPFKFGFV